MKFPFKSNRKKTKSHTARTPDRRRPMVELLEGRLVMTGGLSGPETLVTGAVFLDLNADAARDTGEPGLVGRVVYLDANANQQLDEDETSTTTNANGIYELDLAPGANTIRVFSGLNETATTPATGSYQVTALEGFSATGRDFGSILINPAAPVPQPIAPNSSPAGSDEAFVDDLYRNILGRNAEPAGLALWAGKLSGGESRESVAGAIWNSAEHRSLQVEGYYLSLLNRQFDAAGKEQWVSALLAGASEVQLIRSFLNSAEYQAAHSSDTAFVTGLYEDLLGRAPDADGLASWQTALQKGVSRSNVIDGFLLSPESLQRLVNSFYTTYLNRPSDAGGGGTWVSQLLETQDVRQVGLGILASDENYQTGLGGGFGVGAKGPDTLLNMPGATVDAADKVLYYTNETKKQITISNNGKDTIYPFLQGVNSRTTIATDPWYGTPIFSPYDNYNQEYRGYVGYTEGDNTYMGLKSGESITVNVPEVFWDGGRINVASAPNNLLPKFEAPNNPFHFHWVNIHEIYLASTMPNGTSLSFTQNHGKPDWVTPPTLEVGMQVDGPGIVVGTKIKSLTGADAHTIELDLPVNPLDPAALTNQGYTFSRAADSLMPKTDRFIVNSIQEEGSIENGKIMWYHALQAETPSNDAPAQLLEMTFRDESLADLPTQGYIPLAEKASLVNYDVSYVDSIALSVAMEATDVPVLKSSPEVKGAFGWIGAALPDIQTPLQAFVSQNTVAEPNKNGLGKYFDGQGYPSYYMPEDLLAVAGLKLPSGQNVIADSPFNNVRSSYDNNRYALTSGGDGGIATSIGGASGNAADQDFLLLSTDASYVPLLEALHEGLANGNVYDVSSDGSIGYIHAGTTLTSVDVQSGRVGLSHVTNPGVAPNQSASYQFTRPQVDAAASRLLNLWYSWANYYATHLPGTAAAGPHNGTTTAASRELVITDPFPDSLVEGMLVTKAGVLPHGTTIVRIDKVAKTIYLSQLAISSITAASFDFALPSINAIAGHDGQHVGQLLTFTNDAITLDLYKFAQNAYQVMSAMSTVPGELTEMKVLLNVIGCNVGKLPFIGNTTTVNKDSDSDISNEIRDKIKSLLRGVTDFKVDTETDGNWYPDPSVPTGGHDYNVLNLDPFVWFVHKKLGLSGYGFSVDDDVADVGAPGATKLSIAVGDLRSAADTNHLPNPLPGNLPQKAAWTHGAPYGPITITGTVGTTTPPPGSGAASGPHNTIIVPDSAKTDYWKIYPTDEKNGFVGALIAGHGVTAPQADEPATRFHFRDEDGNRILLNRVLEDVQEGDSITFSFYGPVTGLGVVTAAEPTKITIKDDYVLSQLNTIHVTDAIIRVSGDKVLTKGTKILSIAGNVVELDNPLTPTDSSSFTFF